MKFLLVLFLLYSHIIANDLLLLSGYTFNENNESKLSLNYNDQKWNSDILNIDPDLNFNNYSYFKAFKLSDSFSTGIFTLFGSENSKNYIINFNDNKKIISSIKYDEFYDIKTNYIETTMPTFIALNTSEIFKYKNNEIRKYDIDDKGVISEKITLKIDSIWDFTLIDDYFPSLKHLFIHLPFDINRQQNVMRNILNNLTNLETFGVSSEKEINSHLFIDDLIKNCQSLNTFIFGYKIKVKELDKIKNNCPNLENLIIILRQQDVRYLEKIEFDKSKYVDEINIIEF